MEGDQKNIVSQKLNGRVSGKNFMITFSNWMQVIYIVVE